MGFVLLIFGVALLFIGAVFVAITSYADKRRAELEERCTVPAEAELVSTQRRTIEFSDDTAINYHGVYSYSTGDGQRVQVENENGYGMPEDVPGPRVSIRYNPNNPAEFILPEEGPSIAKVLPNLRKVGIALLVAGALLTIAAVVFLVA